MTTTFTEQQKLGLTFSYMAYLGFGETGTDRENAQKIKGEIDNAIATWPLTKNDWEVVWGPALFSLPGTIFDDAFLFMVRQKSDPNQYYIAIRGTNPVAIPNWIIWDFQAKDQKAWPFVEPTEDFQPKVSESTNFGFNTIYSLRPPIGMPGAQETLLEFLNKELKGKKKAKVCVTGHSLGGALSPTVALWLTDVKAENAFKDTEFSVVAFAGPTAGNTDFANYSNEKLAGKCDRIANSLDIVPHGWEKESMAELSSLYSSFPLPLVLPMPPTWVFLKYLQRQVKGVDYKQIENAIILEGKKYWPQLTLHGPKYTFALLYLGQAVYQHVWAYPQLMGLEDDIPVDELFSLEVLPDIVRSILKS